MPIAAEVIKPQTVRTTCPYCGVGCGIIADVEPSGVVSIKGDLQHPANFGRLCSKGSALAETLSLDDRALYPQIAGKRVSWDEALNAVAGTFRQIITEYGPESVAFYVSGQLLTEDYYVANKLMKGFIGSANIDTNSRLCMSSAVAGYKRAFGADAVPCNYEDLEQAELIVLAGSNLAWCHPVIYQRIVAARKDDPAKKLIIIDPRVTATCEEADLHLQIRPGTDVTLFNGLLNYLRREDVMDLDFIDEHTRGIGAAMKTARKTAGSIPQVALECDLPEEQIATFYRYFATTKKTVTAFSQGVNQSSSGTDKVNSIINCHLVTGRIGKPGMGPFSITGQPNAMGGREVGGLANMLAAHMDFNDAANIERVGRFWQASNMAEKPGLKAVDLFDAVRSGRVRAVWIMATNPVVSLPNGNRVRDALEKCELVVVSDCIQKTDTTTYADILLPASTWGEKDGTVTNSERRISRQRAFLDSPGEAKPDWWIITEVAHRMGYKEHFQYDNPARIFREHAALSGFENGGQRDFDISGLMEIDDKEYDALMPVQWPVNVASPRGKTRLFDDGLFFTSSTRANIIAIDPRPPGYTPNDHYPLILNTGRLRDQWHTMTRTGKSPRLCAHKTEPVIEIHPADAQKYRLKEGKLAYITSRFGDMIARVECSAHQRAGEVFVPMHWNDQFAGDSGVGKLVNPVIDHYSGQPELKHTPVKVAPYYPAWFAFALSKHELDMHDFSYWVKVRGQLFWRYEFAGNNVTGDWTAWARKLLCTEGRAEWIDYLDSASGRYRGARLVDGQLESCLFVSRDTTLPSRNWLGQLFANDRLTAAERTSLLSGQPAKGMQDTGETVCACFAVGTNTIIDAINQGATSVEALGQVLKAGTNCGSCIPELKTLLQSANSPRAVNMK